MRKVGCLVALLAIGSMIGCSSGPPRRETQARAAAAPAADTSGPPVLRVTAAEFATIVHRSGPAATLVNVWATWCEPCREEFPALLSAARQRRDDGLRLVLVSADFTDQLPAVRAFLAAHGVADTTYIKTGEDMAFIDTLSAAWSGALPATFVYDGSGREVAFWEGRADLARFEAAIEQARHSSRVEGGSRP